MFSSSAPSISLEQEQKERDSLTLDEKRALQRDLFGRCEVETPRLVETAPAIRATYEAALDKALKLIPDKEKKEYLEALDSSPVLAKQESNPLAFLRAEEYNPMAAARRIAKYWRMKRLIFDDRAFLPIAEAMTEQDVAMMRKGLVQGLPHDSKGRKIVLLRNSKLTDLAVTRRHFLRAIFFVMYTAVMTDEVAQLNGVVLLSNVKCFDLARNFDRMFARHAAEMMFFALPCRIVAQHTCFGTGGRNMWDDVIGPPLKYLYGKRMRLRTVVHNGSNSELVASLETYHVPKKSIPVCLGGDVDDVPFQRWLNVHLPGV